MSPDAPTRRDGSGRLFDRLEPRTLFSTHPTGMTPAEVRHAYGFDAAYLLKRHVHYAADGAGQTIAIVDAFAAPNIKSDVKTFDKTFHLPNAVGGKKNPFFLRVVAPDGQPSADTGWALEASLDVEWAHAIAPKA